MEIFTWSIIGNQEILKRQMPYGQAVKTGENLLKKGLFRKSHLNHRDMFFFGDYLNISAVNNIVRPVWPRMDDGKISLWTALIDFD